MKMDYKRPWIMGPWVIEKRKIGKLTAIGEVAFVSNWFVGSIADEQMDATVKLASRSPDMAELLIKFINQRYEPDEEAMKEAKKLLIELGYDINQPSPYPSLY